VLTLRGHVLGLEPAKTVAAVEAAGGFKKVLSFVLTCSHLWQNAPCCTCICPGDRIGRMCNKAKWENSNYFQESMAKSIAGKSTRVREMSGCMRQFVKDVNPKLERGSSHTVCACASRINRLDLGIESYALSKVLSPQGCRF
jgi:hypothetical protein